MKTENRLSNINQEETKMRFNDVQDTRKKENMKIRKSESSFCFTELWARLFDENRDHRKVTVSGVTFTL